MWVICACIFVFCLPGTLDRCRFLSYYHECMFIANLYAISCTTTMLWASKSPSSVVFNHRHYDSVYVFDWSMVTPRACIYISMHGWCRILVHSCLNVAASKKTNSDRVITRKFSCSEACFRCRYKTIYTGLDWTGLEARPAAVNDVLLDVKFCSDSFLCMIALWWPDVFCQDSRENV